MLLFEPTKWKICGHVKFSLRFELDFLAMNFVLGFVTCHTACPCFRVLHVQCDDASASRCNSWLWKILIPPARPGCGFAAVVSHLGFHCARHLQATMFGLLQPLYNASLHATQAGPACRGRCPCLSCQIPFFCLACRQCHTLHERCLRTRDQICPVIGK